MSRLPVDPRRTSVHVRTFAEGLLSRLAHDLEIEAKEITGESADAELSRGRLELRVEGLRVVGAVKRGTVDAAVLSARDRSDIEEKIRSEVLPGASVVVDAERNGSRARLTIRTPTGRASVDVAVTVGSDGVASGHCELSLRALGVAPVKGPLGAFRIADRIAVAFRIAFVAA